MLASRETMERAEELISSRNYDQPIVTPSYGAQREKQSYVERY